MLHKKKHKKEVEQTIITHPTSKETISYEENVITPEEFEEIEKREGSGEEEAEKIEVEPKTPKTEVGEIDKLVMKLERLEERVNVMSDVDKAIQDRITKISEEIGELRSSLLERDRNIREMENKVKEFLEIFEEIKPENIKNDIEKKEEEISENKAKIEVLSTQLKEVKREIESFKEIMEKIESFENLVKISEKINEKFSQIEESKKYTSRLAGKVENIFFELNNRVKELKEALEKIEMNEENIKELMKTVDILEIKTNNVVMKEELEKVKKNIREEIEKNKIDVEDKLYDLKDFLEDVIRKIGDKEMLNSKKVIPWKTELENKIKEIENKIEKMKIPENEKMKEIESALKTVNKEIEEMKKEIEIIKKKEEKIESPSSQPQKTEVMSEMPIHIEKWIEENIKKGYTKEELKESLKRGGYDPKYVDIYFSR